MSKSTNLLLQKAVTPVTTTTTTTDEAKDHVPARMETAPKTTTSAVSGIGAKFHVTSIIEFSQDLNDQEAPPPLPEGEYAAEIRASEIKESTNTGNQYLAVQFFISPDSYPADFADGDPDGMTLSYNRIVIADKPQARYRLKKFLSAVGAPLGRSFDPSTLLGLTTNVHVKVGTWEGEPRSEIDKIVG